MVQHRIEYLIREKQRAEEEAKLTFEQKMERAKHLVAQTLESWDRQKKAAS